MSTKIEDLLAAEAKAAEDAEATSDPNAPLPAHVKVTRARKTSRSGSATMSTTSSPHTLSSAACRSRRSCGCWCSRQLLRLTTSRQHLIAWKAMSPLCGARLSPPENLGRYSDTSGPVVPGRWVIASVSSTRLARASTGGRTSIGGGRRCSRTTRIRSVWTGEVIGMNRSRTWCVIRPSSPTIRGTVGRQLRYSVPVLKLVESV